MEGAATKAKEAAGLNTVKTATISDRINALFAAEKWSAAKRLIERETAVNADDHWLLTRLSAAVYELRDYEKAFEILQSALELAPNCPLVLWDLAGTYAMLGKYHEAISVYKRLIKRGVRSIAIDECGEGTSWAKSLVADCWHGLGICYQNLNDAENAVKCFCKHLSLVSSRFGSIYSPSETIKRLLKTRQTPVELLAVSSEIKLDKLARILDGDTELSHGQIKRIIGFFGSAHRIPAKMKR